MSTAPADFEQLLQDAVKHVSEQESKRKRDLEELAIEASRAVSKVTSGAAFLELLTIDPVGPSYLLNFEKNESQVPPVDLGVFQVHDDGYPIHRWWDQDRWERSPLEPDEIYRDLAELRHGFVRLLSDPSSKLVVLVEHLKRTHSRVGRLPQ